MAIATNDGIVEKKRWVWNFIEQLAGGYEIARAGVHCDHFGTEEGVGLEATEGHVGV